MTELKTPFPTINIKRKKALAIKVLMKSLIYAFAIFGILFILLLFAVLGMIRQETGTTVGIPQKAALNINFDDRFSETRGDTLLTELSESSPLSFYDLIKTINVAADDNRVKVLIGRVSTSSLGLAQIQELRQAIEAFRTKGKKAYLFSTGFGSFGNGTSEYYLASAFDEIWMQPNTDVGITGIGIEVPFLRNVMDKIGVMPEFYTRYEYKTAVASLIDREMSKPFKEDIEKLGSSIFRQVVGGIANARQLDVETVKTLINQAPLSSQQALDAKLIDHIGYEAELWDAVDKDNTLEQIDVVDYASHFKDGRKTLPTVAVLVTDGVINEGKSVDNPLQGEATIGSASIIAQLKEIASNKNVKALVLRINSPGGSYAASNEIWYALQRLKQERKIPVIVSMGNYAASGGYFIALAGDKIIAEPSTITGSIGVLGGKMVLAELWKKIGVDWQGIKFGDNADILSSNQNFSEKEKAIFNKSLDNVYKDFTSKVSESRKLDLQQVDKLARGRVWTGDEALVNGLIDELGGMYKSLAVARDAGGIKEDEKFSVVYYPKQKTLQEKISEVLSSAPTATARKLQSELGLDLEGLNMLKRLNYNLMLLPMKIGM